MEESTSSKAPGKIRRMTKWMKAGVWAVVSTAVVTVFSGWLLGIPSLLTVKRVTILVPVQGNERPPELPGDEPYDDKISNDVAHTIRNAELVYANKHPDVERDNFVFRHYPEGKTAEERRRIAKDEIERAKDEDRPAVAIIGHTTSQATLDVAEVYAKHGLTVLMPYATRTGIAKDLMNVTNDGCKIPRALQFPPSNKAQANSIATFLRANNVKSVIVFRDASNSAYSSDCGDELVLLLENPEKVSAATASPPPPRIKVISDVPVSGDASRWYITEEVAAANADAYLVVAMTKPSLEIIRQVARASFKPRLIVLTDGAIDDNLVQRVESSIPTVKRITIPLIQLDSNSNRATEFPPLVIAFPEQEVTPSGYETVFSKGTENAVRGLSHSAYLADAVFMAYGVAVETRQSGVRTWSAAEVFGTKFGRAIAYDAKTGASIPASKLVGPERFYKFTPDGSREAAAGYTLYQVDPSTVTDPTIQGYVRVQ